LLEGVSATGETSAIRPYYAGDRQILDSRSQIVTLKLQRGKNLKYLPYVFTEQGVAMLSAVLRSKRAVEVSIRICCGVRCFHLTLKRFDLFPGQVERPDRT
jgi:hypothetical protein